MKKRMIVLAVAGLFAGSSAAYAAEQMSASVDGFIDTVYTVTNDFAEDTGIDVDGNPVNGAEGKFSTSSEVDFTAAMGSVSARIDLDLFGNAETVEQAYGAWQINDAVALMIGQFNSPMGFEAEDAPELYQTSHSLVWDILNNQTSLDGNNVEGAAVKGNIGPVMVMGALLNEVGGVVDDSNSFMGLVAGSPLEGLDLELSFLTQEDNTVVNSSSAEGLTNLNAAYSMDAGGMPVKVWLDYLTAGALVDSAYSVGGMIGVGGNVSVTLRMDDVSFDDDTIDDQEATTLAATWAAADNLAMLLEWRNDDNGTDDGDTVTLEGVFTF